MKPVVFSKVAAAVLALAPMGAAFVAVPASAQQYRYDVVQAQQSGTIQRLNVTSDGGLRPGATLRLQVFATPDARWASVTFAGSDVRVRLQERAPGEYVGTHVIRVGERIDPTRPMSVRAGWGAGPVEMAFNFPASVQAQAMGSGPAAAPTVSAFAVTGDFQEGGVVRFRLEGTPGARAFVNVPDTVRLPLREVRPGLYVGRYIVRPGDDEDSFDRARAMLQIGERRAVARVTSPDDRYGYGYGR